jgi:redox-sensitive bicupin YhaK (pirin superfamily)
LLLAGEPLREPIAMYGPFVMNTEQQLHEAMHDYSIGKFGVLED